MNNCGKAQKSPFGLRPKENLFEASLLRVYAHSNRTYKQTV